MIHYRFKDDTLPYFVLSNHHYFNFKLNQGIGKVGRENKSQKCKAQNVKMLKAVCFMALQFWGLVLYSTELV